VAILDKVELSLGFGEVEEVVGVVGRDKEGVTTRNQELSRVQHNSHFSLHHHKNQSVLLSG